MARMRAQDRRRQLLAVAADLFAQHGYHGTTTARLAAAAGISEPILYRHFESKRDLFVTLVNEVSREVIAAWRAALEQCDDDEERLRVLLSGNPATHRRGRGIYRVIFQAMTGVEADPEIARALRQHVQRLHGFVAGQLAALQRLDVVRSDEPSDQLAWLLINVAIGHGMIRPLDMRAMSETAARHSMQELLADVLRG